ncbi:hypothetical protein BB559_004651 [Furculomyces boomerangus]|uniref:HIG1 domain-containing protein n=2 Tax=Harpellales TaxID=61421 RepID=A0A2T9YDI0_9FUNG|nr:hypothetical protein BB559_004651 [Furculomyces boomerangus]PVZ98716.1 hypothetical protein BB558_005290 [Smittium angustum]PWA00220.1 hypothetical protein BB558_003737 [Smittium angustum]
MVKVLSEKQEKELDTFLLTNTVYSTALGTVVGVAANYLLTKTWPFYRRLPMGIKGSLIGASILGFMTVRTEGQAQIYERVTYGSDPDVQETEELSALTKPGGFADRSMDYFLENKYKILGSVWAVAAGGSVYALYLNKHITWTQRIVQARMYAQALTIAGLLGAAAVTSIAKKAEEAKKAENAHKK